jgi:hypothetical protein
MATRRSADIPTPTARNAQPAPARAAVSARPARRVQVSAEGRREMIAQAAYLRAERRGFAPGLETEDWLTAELEVDALLRPELASTAQ